MKKDCNNDYYITLTDLLDIVQQGPDAVQIYGYATDTLSTILVNVTHLTELQIMSVKPFSLASVNSCFNEYIFPYYADEVILILHEPTVLEVWKAIDNWVKKLIAKFKLTYDRYDTLLGYYVDKQTELLNSINTVSESRVNDTPQNGGDYTSDTYTSLYNKQTVASQRDTLMERLSSIQDKYANVMQDWLNEFRGLFIYSLPYDMTYTFVANEDYYID